MICVSSSSARKVLAPPGERERWLVEQFVVLTEELLLAIRHKRLNARGFSRQFCQLFANAPPLTSGVVYVCVGGRACACMCVWAEGRVCGRG